MVHISKYLTNHVVVGGWRNSYIIFNRNFFRASANFNDKEVDFLSWKLQMDDMFFLKEVKQTKSQLVLKTFAAERTWTFYDPTIWDNIHFCDTATSHSHFSSFLFFFILK